MSEEKKQLNNSGKELETLQTYMSDMADAVKDKEMSVVKIAAAEQKSRERGDYYRRGETSSRNKTPFIMGGIVFIILAIFISYFLIKKTKEKNLLPQIIPTIQTPISYDNKITVNTTGATNRNDISKLINQELIRNNNTQLINYLSFVKQDPVSNLKNSLSLNDLLSLLKTTASDSLVRSFSSDYMVGTYAPREQAKASLFLIIGISNYDVAYAGMLDWEKTITDDLFSLFNIDVSGDNSNLFEKPFSDIIINNKDARVLYNNKGVGQLFYLFPNKNTLVISSNKNAIREIITRLLIKEIRPK